MHSSNFWCSSTENAVCHVSNRDFIDVELLGIYIFDLLIDNLD